MKYLKISFSKITLERIIIFLKFCLDHKKENKRIIQSIFNLLNYLKFQNSFFLSQIKNFNLNVFIRYNYDYKNLIKEIFNEFFIIKEKINRKRFICKLKFQIYNIYKFLKEKINKFIKKYSLNFLLNLNEFKEISYIDTFPQIIKTNFFN